MSRSEEDSCLAPALLGRFVEGSLSWAEREQVVRHISRCARCRYAVARGIEAEERERASVAPRAHAVRWWMPVAAALLIIVIAYPLFRRSMNRRIDPTTRLVAMMPKGERMLEPRLTGGFHWAPLQRARRSSSAKTPDELIAEGAAGSTFRAIGNDPSDAARHAAARAHLIAGDARSAIGVLDDLARRRPDDASVWSDLAAALYADGDARDDSVALQRALAAADRAVSVAPRMPEAAFNRALIIEQTRPPAEARNAWQHYLQIDPDSQWSREARERLARL